MPQITVGHVRGLAQPYADGLERCEIWVNKKSAGALPYVEGKRVAIELHIGDQTYEAGLRTTPAQQVVAICPDLRDNFHKKVCLASALKVSGFTKNQKVILEASGKAVTVAPAR